ncbi:MAG TPA: zinc-binding dehydrogenase [Clostridia bacterium]|nr:zinc-binding dehydrogenase [Clostridia bacterium]
MKTIAVRLYGKNDLRLESFELPAIKDDEILAKIYSDSICMSSYKAAIQGADHKRIPDDVEDNPIILGHEFCGELIEVGAKWQNQFAPGDKYVVQPALNDPKDPYAAPGYSFQYVGGNATYVVLPAVVMEQNCLLKYTGEAYYYGSLTEPMSCIIGGFNVNYHTKIGSYEHIMGMKQGGNMASLAGVGPMGLGAIELAIHGPHRPGLLVVTDIDEARLRRAATLLTIEEAKSNGVELHYVNTSGIKDVVAHLRGLTKDDHGYDDVYVFAPVRQVVEEGDKLLAFDGCMNFFAGPTNTEFAANLNFYNVHYNGTHIAANSGGNANDMEITVDLMSKGQINPTAMLTHIGGLDCAIETTLNLPQIPGGKKLLYTHISLPLTAISNMKKLGETDPLMRALDEIVERHNGLWSVEAERYLLDNATPIEEVVEHV